jgi:hypothetical protein
VANDDGRSVQRFEGTAGRAHVHGLQAVVGQVLYRGGHIVDAKHQMIGTNNIHANLAANLVGIRKPTAAAEGLGDPIRDVGPGIRRVVET